MTLFEMIAGRAVFLRLSNRRQTDEMSKWCTSMKVVISPLGRTETELHIANPKKYTSLKF